MKTVEPIPVAGGMAEHTRRSAHAALLAASLVGWMACVAGYHAEPRRMAASYLVAFLFFVTIGLGGLFFLMVQHLSGAAWSVTSRRIAENLVATLPAAVVLFVPVALNLSQLYEWSHPELTASDALLRSKQAWLNPTGFLLRAAAYLAVWSLFSLALTRISLRQDAAAGGDGLRRAARWSAAGMVAVLLSATLAAFDWVMSLEPHWYSTIFGIYVYAGGAVAFMAALIVVLLALRQAGHLRREVNVEHYHDLGKWLFALVVFWAYIAFSQYLLIWYANLPEETVWFRRRIAGGWTAAALVLVLGHFLLPFFALMGRAAKRRLTWLGLVSLWMLGMHYLDLYWQVMPVFSPTEPQWHWMDAAALLAVAGPLGLVFLRRLRAAPLMPVGDPRLAQSLEFHNA